MIRNILKEIIIVLLLALAIILILGVLLYEYVPGNKIIPEKISYTTPENVQTELQKENEVDESEIVITYHIDSTDLNNYKKMQEYVPGKKNPFASLEKDEENNEEQSGENTSTSGNNSTSGSGTTENNDKQTGYLPDRGTK